MTVSSDRPFRSSIHLRRVVNVHIIRSAESEYGGFGDQGKLHAPTRDVSVTLPPPYLTEMSIGFLQAVADLEAGLYNPKVIANRMYHRIMFSVVDRTNVSPKKAAASVSLMKVAASVRLRRLRVCICI